MTSPLPTPADKKQSKKQKNQPTDTRPEPAQKEKKRKKKHHEDVNTTELEAKSTEPAQVTDEDVERPEKRQKNDEPETHTSAEQQTVETQGALSKKPKREKRPKKPKDKSKVRKEEAPNPKDKIQIADVPIPHTNPLTDGSLSDPVQRGLAYAYQYAQHISLVSESERAAKQPWKFNKARQNWILRNAVDPTSIPDPYLPITLIYIESIQGGARNELKKTCKSIKKQAKASKTPSSEDPSGPKPEVDQSPETPTESVKKVTFAAGATEPTATESGIPAPSKVKVKRAKTILKVLKGEIRPQDV